MALIATYCTDIELRKRVDLALRDEHALARSASWDGLERLVRERPVTVAVLDLSLIPGASDGRGRLFDLKQDFPELAIVLVVRPGPNAETLFRVGRAGFRHLALADVGHLEPELRSAVRNARTEGATATVHAAVSPFVDDRAERALRLAMDSVHRRLRADEFADEMGFSRPFLSECLKSAGLPSVGHLLLWARLLHAGQWLGEPGRTAESVARQLEYSSGAAFRRALKHYTGATPTEVIEAGGLPFVLDHFVRACHFFRQVA